MFEPKMWAINGLTMDKNTNNIPSIAVQ